LVGDDKEFIHGHVTVSAYTNRIYFNARNLCLHIVRSSLKVGPTGSRLFNAVFAIDIMVVITIRDDEKDFLNAGATKFELLHPKSHSSGD